jgi:flagellar hook-associated protein 2
MSANQPISLSGLASGLDTDSIVTALMQIEQQPKVRLTTQQSQVQSRQSALQDLKGRLTTLKLAADSLRSVGLFADTQSLDSSDTTKITAQRVSGAGTGGSQVVVSRLASSQQRTYSYTPDSSSDTVLDFGGGKTLTVAAGTSIDDLVSQVNSATGSPVYAASITDPNDSSKKLLVLSSKTPGANGDFLLQPGTTAGVVEDPAKAKAQAGQLNNLNAAYSVDGGATQYAASNVVTDAIPGIELTFKAASAQPVTITVGSPGPDHGAIKSAVKNFVSQYNSTVDFINSKVKEQRVVNPSTAGDKLKGLFFGDPLLTGIQSRLRIAVTSPIGSDPSLNLLSQIGVSTGATTGGGAVSQDSIAGKLTVDEDKLDTMLSTNPDGVQKLLGAATGISGFGQTIDDVLDPEVGSGLDFDQQISAMDRQLRDIADQMSSMDVRLAATQQRLKAQFTAMETALSSSQSQQQWLAGQIAGLSSGR